MQWMSPKEYEKMNQKASPPTPVWKTVPMAFLFGGIICTIGQLCSMLYQNLGADLETASASTSITLIFLAALLTGLNVFDKIAKIGGAGCLVPITGFSNAVVSPALEFKAEGLVLGLGAKMFVIAGPVIVYGITASVIYGILCRLFGW